MTEAYTPDADAIEFFIREGGFGYDPATETADEAKLRGATQLAAAERWARDNCVFPQWVKDNNYSPDDYDMDGMPDTGWGCILTGPDGEVASLWAITFDSEDSAPWGQPYARVVAAELALELMPD